MTFVLAYIIACRYHAVINNDDKNGPTILSRASCWIFRKGKNHTSVTLHTKTTSLTDDLPLTPTVVIWVICHMLPDWVKPSFVIFDIRALWRRLMVSLISQQQFTLSPLTRVVRLSLYLPRVSHVYSVKTDVWGWVVLVSDYTVRDQDSSASNNVLNATVPKRRVHYNT